MDSKTTARAEDVTARLFSVDTAESLARECLARGITAAQRVQEEIDDCADEGIVAYDPDGQCAEAIEKAMAALKAKA